MVADGVTAFDEWGRAISKPVNDARARAETLPAHAEVEARAARELGRAQSRWLVAASALFLVSAAILGRMLLVDREPVVAEVPRATAQAVAVTGLARSASHVRTEEPVSATPPPPPLPPLPETTSVTVSDLPTAAPAVDLDHARPSASSSARRVRPSGPRRRPADIVRDTPF
ncbi:MAG: hypothetical protein U0235_28500 [Polyangiaceae bacterium]